MLELLGIKNKKTSSFIEIDEIDSDDDMDINIKNEKWKNDFSPIEDDSELFADKAYSKAYLRHLIHSGEILGAQIATLHNLHFYLWLVTEARKKIIAGEFYNWKNLMVNRLGQRL